MERYTIADFNRNYPDDDACLEWLKNHLYPEGIHCKVCGKITKHHKITTRRSYSCDICGNHFHPTAGTIFEKSTTPLKLWFHAIFLMANTRCGISAKQIERETGVTYKTAWRMFNQIRSLLQCSPRPSSGEFEVDETYIGGKRPGKRGRGASGKTPVFGIAKRQGYVSASKVSNLKSATVYPLIKQCVLENSQVYTDEFPIYDRLYTQGYKHKRVNHSAEVWALEKAHTNTIEGFWSLLKRGISGVYHAVSEKYLQDYIDEYVFRYNHRKDEKPMFLTILSKIATT
jgi:transposase